MFYKRITNIFSLYFENSKNKLEEFDSKYSDQSIAIKKIEKFCKRYLILSSNSFEDYINGNQRISKILLTLFSRLILAVFMLKFLLIVISSDNLIKIITNDQSYLMGKPQLISTMLSICAFTVFIFGIHIQYEELNHSFVLIDFMHSLKALFITSVFKLNSNNRRKFGLRLNIFTEFFVMTFHRLAVILVSLVLITFLFLAYLEPKSGYYLALVIFWSVITILWAIYFYAILAFLGTLFYLTTLFLKYKFTEIDETISSCVENQDIQTLMQTIVSHNKVSLLTKQLNRFFNVLIFVVYYLGTLSIHLMIYTTHEKSSKFPLRLAACFVVAIVFSAALFIGTICGDVIRTAHKPYAKLFKFSFIQNNISINEKMKIQAFIEHLSGPPIGFYCLDLFPMTTYKFFMYIYGSSSFYLLLITNF